MKRPRGPDHTNTMLDNGKALSPLWGKVSKEDIGSGFRRANKAIAQKLIENSKNSSKDSKRIDSLYRKLKMKQESDERQGKDRHPFLNGSSRFIFYVLKPPKIVKKPSRFNTRKVINAQSTLTAAQKLKFAKTLGSNIDRTTKFFVEDLLPRTEALMTGLVNVDEAMQQIADDSAKLPLEFIRRKAMDAAYLRIVRFLSQQYELTKSERKLMLSEFIAKAKPPLF